MSRTAAASPPPAVLYDIDWRTYTRVLRALEGPRRFRLTYDRGTLEIRYRRLLEHEGPAQLLGCLVAVLTEELNLPSRSGGQVTLRRKRKQRGLESGGCFWIANAARMRGKLHLDLRTDPPPDLALEVHVAGSSLDRISIFAALGVSDIWHLRANDLTFNVLHDGTYRPQPNSLLFPPLASADLSGFLALWPQSDDTTIVRRFREMVRQTLVPPSAI
jgi:Uma2 family endonuclease